MASERPLVGRDREVALLQDALAAARRGNGGLLLIAGEAGVGKTRLVGQTFATARVHMLEGEAEQGSTPPYGPVLLALRAFLREAPDGLARCGPLLRQLALVLPELGHRARSPDRVALQEALRRAFEVIAEREPTVVLLDDLHWADETTLVDVLPVLARSAAERALLVVGVYRNDEVPRGHPLRQLRRRLRQAGLLQEVVLEPLDETSTRVLAAEVLGRKPAARLAAVLYERTQGVPFFVEELAAMLAASGRLRAGRRGLDLGDGDDIPVPDSVRETIALRVERLSEPARKLLEVAAVAGQAFPPDLVVELAGNGGLEECVELGLLEELAPGHARFRHALTWEALYADVPWTRRRMLHALVAERMTERGAAPAAVAGHWLAARELGRACAAYLAAAQGSAAVYAHRDALVAGRRGLEIWPDGVDEGGRLALLELIGSCALVCSELSEAAAAWRELGERRRMLGDLAGVARAERQLATTYELQGSPERTLVARRRAAAAFTASGSPAQAAEELLAAAAQLDSAGHLGAAVELLAEAREHADAAGRLDLRARTLGIEATVSAKLGRPDAALAAARTALELSLGSELADVAADAYQRVANVFENAGDYESAWDAYQTGLEFCEARGLHAGAQVCLVCLAAICVFTGEWDRALELDRSILRAPHAPAGPRMGAKQHMGLIGAARGETKRSRRLLTESGTYAARHARERMEVWDAMGQAWIDELERQPDVALDRCAFILERWGASESLHYPVPALRWATTFCATHDAETQARACAGALSGLAAKTVNPEALAALAHGLGETALLDGDPEQAGARFEQALGLLADLHLPYEAAQTQLRAGAALLHTKRREQAIERLEDAYRTARRLGAQPLADRAARALSDAGEAVDRRLGRRAAAKLDGPGLTRRELEVVRLIARGRTNRQIAGQLFLSTRTVDMHVRNSFRKLDCRTRAEATRKAAELGLLV